MAKKPKRQTRIKKARKPLSETLPLELILNNTEEALMLLDRELNVVYFNKAFENYYRDFFGKAIEEGHSILSYSLPGIGVGGKSVLSEVLQGVFEQREFSIQQPRQKSNQNYLATYKPFRDKKHRIIGILISFRGSEREAQNKRFLSTTIINCFNRKGDLKNSLDLLLTEWCSYFNQRAAEVWVTDTDSKNIRLLLMHEEGEPLKLTDLKVTLMHDEGLPGKTWKRGVPVFIKDVQKHSTYLRKKFAGVNRLKSATAIPIMYEKNTLAVFIFYNNSNQEAKPVILDESIISQLASDIQRKTSEDNLVKFFTYAPELLCIAGPDGYFKKVNPAFARLLGYDEDELLSQPFTNFVHPDDQQNTKARLKDISSGQVIFSFENRYRTKSNEWKWISWSTSEFLNDAGLVFAYGKDITEEKRLRDLLYSTGELARVGSWEINLSNNRTYLSPTARRIYEIDDFVAPDLDLKIFFFKEGESRESIKRMIRDGIDKGIGWNAELQIVSAKGNERWGRIIGESEFINGRCIRLFGSIQDIHERKMAKLEIEKVLEEKKNILESIGDGFFTMDSNWVITYWNKQAERITKKPKEQVVGHYFSDVYPENRYTQFHAMCVQAMTAQQAQNFESHNELEKVWYDISIYPNANGLSVYFKDTTARTLADEKLRQSNERFELIAKATKDAVWDYDLQTRTFTHIGDGFTQLFGYPLDAMSDDIRFLASLVHPDEIKGVIDLHARAIEDTNQNYVEAEYRVKKHDGKYAHVLECCYIMRDQYGKALRIMGANQDITFRKEHEQSLEILNAELQKYANNLAASNAELEQFAYVASHDMQEPLRMVSSFLTLLEKNYNDKLDERGKQYIHFAVDGAKRMKQIIMDLLEYSRVGRFSKEEEEVNLPEVLGEIISLFKNLIDEKKAVVKLGHLPVIRSHRTPIRQVFQNLIGNALKYTKPDVEPQLTVTCVESEREYQFEVSDNGVGISPSHFEKIFVIFQRLYTRGEYEGTGIGLSICKRIVETMGGKIWVTSEEGVGSSFYFTVPRHPQR